MAEDFDAAVRTFVIRTLRDTSYAPAKQTIADAFDVPVDEVSRALARLADTHRLVLSPGTDRIWMVHPFSAVATDCVARIGRRSWYANCAWDGLAILALIGDGALETRSPATGDLLQFSTRDGTVHGEGVVHFLVPARSFWDDIAFT